MKKNLLLTSIAILFFVIKINAQVTYCEPTFLNGCFTWSNQQVDLDTLHWTLGSTDCAVSDYTSLQATVTKGVATPMTVMNGAWCGVGVWIDYNFDGNFDSTENVYNKYNAASAQTYSFLLSIPQSVPDSVYRMRVIAGWGTDCYSSTSTNGFGACGQYQYGNFDDFSLRVIDASVGVSNISKDDVSLSIYPNPASDQIHAKINSSQIGTKYFVVDQLGKTVLNGKFEQESSAIDISNLAEGVYVLSSGTSKQMFKVVR